MKFSKPAKPLKFLPTFFQKDSKLLPIKGISTFHTRYAPNNCIPYIATRYLRDFDNPIRPKIFHTYENRERGILWWTVVDASLVDAKAVVRTCCKKRVRAAFRAALRERGYDLEGRKILRDAEGTEVRRQNALKGTLEIRLNPNVFKVKSKVIARDMKRLLDNLENKPAKPDKPAPARGKSTQHRVRRAGKPKLLGT